MIDVVENSFDFTRWTLLLPINRENKSFIELIVYPTGAMLQNSEKV